VVRGGGNTIMIRSGDLEPLGCLAAVLCAICSVIGGEAALSAASGAGDGGSAIGLMQAFVVEAADGSNTNMHDMALAILGHLSILCVSHCAVWERRQSGGGGAVTAAAKLLAGTSRARGALCRVYNAAAYLAGCYADPPAAVIVAAPVSCGDLTPPGRGRQSFV
jgi:hypothetical protein